KVANEGLRRLAARGGSLPHELPLDRLAAHLEATALERQNVSRLYYWAAANWGSWSKQVGLVDAVRNGVANRLRTYLSVA
ncbi:MAG: hypothetical protein GWN37_20200, partial [Gammaproteobacteria bacterium]|nr:hypothetical protein [Gammaproteobacteria bacterium]